MIRVYHAPYTRSIRILWLLEEMGFDYEVIARPMILETTTHTQDTPSGKVPVLLDDNVVIEESIAIMQYLLEKPAGKAFGFAVDDPLWPSFLGWLHFSEATAMPPITQISRHTLALPEAERVDAVAQDQKRVAGVVFERVAQALGEQTFLVGNRFSAVDIALTFPLVCGRMFGLLDQQPRLVGYLEGLLGRSAFKRAQAR